MNIYKFDSYILFLRSSIEEVKRAGIMSELAQKAGCNRTYLSQVLAGKAHLTADHALNLADAFHLNEQEADFFLMLLLRERSASNSARNKFDERIRKARANHLKYKPKLSSAYKTKKVSVEVQLRFYSDWRYQAATTLTLVPHTQSLSAISERLGLPSSETAKLLQDLQEWGFIKKKGERYLSELQTFANAADGSLAVVKHSAWRARAVDQLRRGGGQHASLMLTLSSQDAILLKSRWLEFIEENRTLVSQSKPIEEAYAFCFDMFRLD